MKIAPILGRKWHQFWEENDTNLLDTSSSTGIGQTGTDKNRSRDRDREEMEMRCYGCLQHALSEANLLSCLSFAARIVLEVIHCSPNKV
jgi:hypothetical protein